MNTFKAILYFCFISSPNHNFPLKQIYDLLWRHITYKHLAGNESNCISILWSHLFFFILGDIMKWKNRISLIFCNYPHCYGFSNFCVFLTCSVLHSCNKCLTLSVYLPLGMLLVPLSPFWQKKNLANKSMPP